MNKKVKLIETFDQTPSISLVEEVVNSTNADSRVDGKYIIGMIEGQFFKPDGMSRNQRWYPRSLWENVLSSADVKNRFATSTMFGEIGHSDGPVEDLTLRSGCASHFVDKMWIDDKGRGMGRAYILNTPTGQLLKTYLGAGCKLKVSTRGEGLYKEGETHEGCPIIDDNSYDLQTADFVINPGFLETSATLRESYENLNNYTIEQKRQIEETLAHVTRKGENNMTLDMDAYVQELKEELKAVKAENKSLNEELKAKEKDLLQKQFEESAEIKKINEEFKPFKDMKVSAKTLNETLKRSQVALKEAEDAKAKLEEELKGYVEKCGSLEQIDEATKLSAKSLKVIEAYRKLGSLKELEDLKENAVKALEKIKASNDLHEEVKKLTSKLDSYKTLEESAAKALKIIEAYKAKFGALNAPKTEKKADVKNEALTISKKYHCTVESAAKLIAKHGVEKTVKMMESKLGSKPAKTVNLKEGKELVEKVAQLDDAKVAPSEKSANDFLTKGVIQKYFDNAIHGREIKNVDVNNLPDKPNAAKQLLAKYDGKFDTEKAPAVNQKFDAAAAEKVAKSLLK